MSRVLVINAVKLNSRTLKHESIVLTEYQVDALRDFLNKTESTT
jgi:hypothetical protein